MPSNDLQLYRITFDHAEFLKLPEAEQLFFVRLAQVMDDLRHVFYLCVSAEKGTRSNSADERKIAMHQLLFGVRLIYSILLEGWKIIDSEWNGRALGKSWHARLSYTARAALDFLGKYFAKPNLARTIRDNFGFHYLRERLAEPLAHVPKAAAEVITGKYSANVFYTLAEQVRSLAMLQATQPNNAPKLWDHNASEDDIRKAAIRLYESFKPVRDAFDTFANGVLTTIVKSLTHKSEKFAIDRHTKFSEMSPVLFVEEPKN
ncbi:MAG TPA: hypothetical protein VFA51_12245 [Candidatus Udaeobacter sp.]|nr:hypothetical protein [Candidatus Udaeobacter sp.]